MFSPWILRIFVLITIQFIGCDNLLLQSNKTTQPKELTESSATNTNQPCDSDQIYDMLRERCVTICKTSNCCTNIVCPEGATCINELGICGIPVDNEIYDLGFGWWTGKSTNQKNQKEALKRPVSIQITNNNTDTVFLKANYRQKAFIEISSIENPEKTLVIPENYFCPQWCPDKGMPMEIDCGRPREIIVAIPPGQSHMTEWSGLELFDVIRYSKQTGNKPCVKKGQTIDGTYQVKVCFYKEYTSPNVKGVEQGNIRNGKIKGIPYCVYSTISFPNESRIEINI